MQRDIKFIMSNIILEMIPTDNKYYLIFIISKCNNSKVIGGTILGDKEEQTYRIRINNDGNKLELGNTDDTKVRGKDFVDNFNEESFLEKFKLLVTIVLI